MATDYEAGVLPAPPGTTRREGLGAACQDVSTRERIAFWIFRRDSFGSIA